MLFNSINFAIFLPIVFACYWLLNKGNLKVQNLLLLIASYFFYACWDYRFLFLLIFSTFLDYYSGIKINESQILSKKKIWFWTSIIVNLGFLGFFKYYNFFASSFAECLQLVGFKPDFWTLQILLPAGISFYTFHGLSYVIDIYYGRIKPEKDFVAYSVFVSFFPLLVAGPIERATHLLPQILKKREFDYTKAVDGLRQILWGLFKKVVIADNCSEYVNTIFSNSEHSSGSTLVLGAFFFVVQVYCDFSGYSDIALGTARLFGIELLQNFWFPLFSRNVSEFWRRWNMSVGTWFRDYVYIPLGGNKCGTWKKVRNTFIVFIVSGFWHGANWTYICWGTLNALYITLGIIFGTSKNYIYTVAKGRILPSVKEFLSIITTFSLVLFSLIFFRAESITQAINYVKNLFSISLFSIPQYNGFKSSLTVLLLVLLFIIVEWFGREHKYPIAKLELKWPRAVRWTIYIFIICVIFMKQAKEQKFIYFQF